jgi:hypothetical protein
MRFFLRFGFGEKNESAPFPSACSSESKEKEQVISHSGWAGFESATQGVNSNHRSDMDNTQWST